MLRMIIGAVVLYFVFWFLNRIMSPKKTRMKEPPQTRNREGRSAIDAEFEELNDRDR